MKKFNLAIIALSMIIFATSCSKDDPTPEIDQEEVGVAKLIFTEVEREEDGDHAHYHDINNPETSEITFSGANMLPPVGEHLHLEVGKSYRLQLVATDFAGRETQQTFISRADIHQAFILGAPANALSYEYADVDASGASVNVGVTGYLTVNATANTFTLNYILRHLNDGVKANITAADWNNANYTQFTGANDLDLKVSVHLVNEGDHDH
ncbi:hypothetical protein PQ465_08060 [Sphingobacterium oryzagri]|uniref:DUF4625 domain-containing protein n=1 Tax=Sphingobacterium oryzagri TaxID=3025669 RepID=A0ABY7WL43_9SPHI|nr:hypothetical protein [Sphingobacterium sp. KACC 22765]WDF70321.1 hypothetical protein PQ465_08060 [Sphingobacterium sp. KACC 22765]